MKTILTTNIFDAWFSHLKDRQGKRRIQARIDRAEDGHFGDCKPIGEGVFEMRVHTGPGYRVYFTQKQIEIVILLAGGDKSSQERDVKTALQLAQTVGAIR